MSGSSYDLAGFFNTNYNSKVRNLVNKNSTYAADDEASSSSDDSPQVGSSDPVSGVQSEIDTLPEEYCDFSKLMQRFIYPLEFCEHYEIEICYGAPEQEKQEAVD